jgi:hypothetical protein
VSGAVLFVVVGAVALAAGGTTLARPDVARRLLGVPEGEAATYGLRIGGMMVASFGLILVAFVLATGAGAAR